MAKGEWQPVALLDEMTERPVTAVRIFGQDFMLFRDEAGRYGLLDRDCPHRGADLSYGRLEPGEFGAFSTAGYST
jgi:phenylpropionate dioxygenase-like ring-hydroxylating dioxygenase large terminal subunit